MNEHLAIPAMSPRQIDAITSVEAELLKSNQQLDLWTQHVLHAGMYCRTVLLPQYSEMVGALIKIPTTVIVSGDACVRINDQWSHLLGYNVLPASANRKQHFFANQDTYISMFFPSQAHTVDEAEREFTDEFASLLTHRMGFDVETIITGEG